MKKVLITGSGTGLGTALTKLFLKNNWIVAAVYFDRSKEFDNLQGKYAGESKLECLKCNFLNKNDLTELLDYIASNKFDALVNNAGVHDYSVGKYQNIEKINEVFHINTIVPTFIAESAMIGMKTKRSGKIVNVSSIGVKYGSNINSVFYGASKSALETITKSLAREAAPYNILVNAIRAGVIDTDFFHSLGKDENTRKKMIPLKRFANPKEISEYIYFLCSTNSYITGETVSISGGE